MFSNDVALCLLDYPRAMLRRVGIKSPGKMHATAANDYLRSLLFDGEPCHNEPSKLALSVDHNDDFHHLVLVLTPI